MSFPWRILKIPAPHLSHGILLTAHASQGESEYRLRLHNRLGDSALAAAARGPAY